MKPAQQQPPGRARMKQMTERKVSDRVYDTQAGLIEGRVTPEELTKAVAGLLPRHYVDVVAERAADGLCGFPCCGNPLPISQRENPSSGRPRYRVSLSEGKVEEVSQQLRDFCCPRCAAASGSVLESMDETPLLMRKQFKDCQPPPPEPRVAGLDKGGSVLSATVMERDVTTTQREEPGAQSGESAVAVASSVEGYNSLSRASVPLPFGVKYGLSPFVDMGGSSDDEEEEDDVLGAEEGTNEGNETVEGDHVEEEDLDVVGKIELGTAALSLSDHGWCAHSFQTWRTQETCDVLKRGRCTMVRFGEVSPVVRQRRTALAVALLGELSAISDQHGMDTAPVRADVAELIDTFEMSEPVRSFTPRQSRMLALVLVELCGRRVRDPRYRTHLESKMPVVLESSSIMRAELDALINIFN